MLQDDVSHYNLKFLKTDRVACGEHYENADACVVFRVPRCQRRNSGILVEHGNVSPSRDTPVLLRSRSDAWYS